MIQIIWLHFDKMTNARLNFVKQSPHITSIHFITVTFCKSPFHPVLFTFYSDIRVHPFSPLFFSLTEIHLHLLPSSLAIRKPPHMIQMPRLHLVPNFAEILSPCHCCGQVNLETGWRHCNVIKSPG